MKRKEFIALGSMGILVQAFPNAFVKPKLKGPIIISTWDEGRNVNQTAWPILSSGGLGLDAIEKGGNYIENQINCCVGLGGNPDRDGRVTLDASVMDFDGRTGAVAALERIKHPISVARQVMEKTPHVLLVGQGAQQFALEMGHTLESGELSVDAKKQYEAWLKEKKYQPRINIENATMPLRTSDGGFNHDTMAMIARDGHGHLVGGVTTSGMGFKMRGRVGDSPIIGAGLYVDNEVGAATSSGVGEEVIRIVGSHLVVELMRQGRNPTRACKEAVMRIVEKSPERAKQMQVGFIALDKHGNYGSFALQPGFVFAVKSGLEEKMVKTESVYR
jgi:N4-(beta-N-acetylglucosaminyl)-L-asparaginase